MLRVRGLSRVSKRSSSIGPRDFWHIAVFYAISLLFRDSRYSGRFLQGFASPFRMHQQVCSASRQSTGHLADLNLLEYRQLDCSKITALSPQALLLGQERRLIPFCVFPELSVVCRLCDFLVVLRCIALFDYVVQ
jgi:hypothetical protein